MNECNAFSAKLQSYPEDVVSSVLEIRRIIIAVADKDGITDLTETLKWGEPSFVGKTGSTIRVDWKAKTPDQIAIYFNCKSALVETFKEIYGHLFSYEGNRAIVFQRGRLDFPAELSHCISLALNYHQIKHLPLLGA